MRVTVPAFIPGRNDEVERLILRFGNCRHRAYSMEWKGVNRLEIIKRLSRDMNLPYRYVDTAYDTVKGLPAHVTFGGLRLQRLRESGKITREEYRERRNSILACRGQAGLKGNLCLRIEKGNTLRITTGFKHWIRVPLFIPEKYRNRLEGTKAHTIFIKRRPDKGGYDVKITVDVDQPEAKHVGRLMALDVNSGHVDFAVADKATFQPVVFGRVDCHELLDARKDKKRVLLHRLVNKVGRIAEHYGAEVVAGKLRSNYTNNRHRFNRRIQGMNQFEMRRILAYKLPMKGISVSEGSEAYTSKVGEKLAAPLGLDVHKAAAYAFAIKTMDCRRFWSLSNGLTFLHESCAHEGDGIPSRGRRGGSGLTVPSQSLTRLMCSELGIPLPGEATPNQGTGGWPPWSAQSSILQVKV
jgi:IS605 OrfB family transposase